MQAYPPIPPIEDEEGRHETDGRTTGAVLAEDNQYDTLLPVDEDEAGQGHTMTVSVVVHQADDSPTPDDAFVDAPEHIDRGDLENVVEPQVERREETVSQVSGGVGTHGGLHPSLEGIIHAANTAGRSVEIQREVTIVRIMP